ncbi:MAG: hypothetical protein WCQ90_15080 [Deltaproteobacteria bacterium]
MQSPDNIPPNTSSAQDAAIDGSDSSSRMYKLRQYLRPSSKIVQFIVVDRLLGLLVRVIDVSLVVMAIADPSLTGAIRAFIILTPINFAFCLVVIIGTDLLLRVGVDITAIEEFRSLKDKELKKREYLQRACRWILQQKRTIFWIGSWFLLDPDYVTLLIRDRRKGLLHAITTITIPSVLLAMIVWVPFIWIAVNAVKAGYTWAQWFLT